MQIYHQLRFEWPSGAGIEIESVSGESANWIEEPLVPNATGAATENKLDPLAQRGIPALAFRPEPASLYEPLQLREQTDYLVDITLPIPREVAREKWGNRKSWPLPSSLDKYFRCDPPKRWQKEGELLYLTGHLNFRSYVGIADLSVPHGGQLRCEVACAKIGYFEDFQALLDAIADEFIELLVQVQGPTSFRFQEREVGEDDPLVQLFHLRRIMRNEQLPAAVKTISRSPHAKRVTEEEHVAPHEVRHPSPSRITRSMVRGGARQEGPLSELFRGYTPQELPKHSVSESLDTKENRYVKSFLTNLSVLVQNLADKLREAGKKGVVGEVEEWEDTLTDLLARDFWREVGQMTYFPSNSQLLQRKEGYRQIFEIDLSLQFGFQLPWKEGVEIADGLEGSARPVSKLYQYWCFFLLRSALRQICGPEGSEGSLISEDGSEFSVKLAKGKESKIKFEYDLEDENKIEVILFHNRKFKDKEKNDDKWTESYTYKYEPDFSILIIVDSEKYHWLHMDAKYKIDLEDLDDVIISSIPKTEKEILSKGNIIKREEKGSYEREDLHKMHAYRDGLLGSRGAYVFYPGSGADEDIFLRHPSDRYSDTSRPVPSVGAFQLHPDMGERQIERVKNFLDSTFRNLAKTGSYQEEEFVSPE
jgi:predicted component of viral defense system (DUF524 family)